MKEKKNQQELNLKLFHTFSGPDTINIYVGSNKYVGW